MKRQISLKTLVLICTAGLIVACGGGGAGGGGPIVPGIDRTGANFALAFGSITGFGSIIVNGVRYDTSSASFTIDDSPGSEAELQVGDIVLIRGTLSSTGTTGTATSVTFGDNVEGPIEAGSINLTIGTLVVLGQMIRTNAGTSFDNSIPGASLTGLVDGDIIEVSGFVNADGDILATRIELKTPGGELEVTGIVEGHLPGAMTFMINALVVNYAGAMLDNDFPGGVITDGDLVEAKGLTVNGAGELVATEVDFEDDQLAGSANDHVEIEGLITRFGSATDFDVSGFPVTTNGQTVFEGGVAGDLGLNVKVEAEGNLNAAGVLVADKVDIRRDSVVEVEGLVDTVNASGGTVTVLGIAIHVDSLTRVEDKRDDVQPFGLTNIVAGDFIAVRGSEDANAPGEVLASRLERDDPDDTLLQGIVETVAEPSITILGVTIDTTGAIFRNELDQPIASGAFFGRPPAGELVKAKGTEVADTAIDADEVEFETP